MLEPVQADRPTLIECIRFRGRHTRINIPERIGTRYTSFGILLLEDVTGSRVESLIHKHQGDSEQINRMILQEWIAGNGRHPVTWKTLVDVLRDIDLNALAAEIKEMKDIRVPGEATDKLDLEYFNTGVYVPRSLGILEIAVRTLRIRKLRANLEIAQ